ncbi:hypothetical protein [Neobacillus terrae]|uniref:hypothetical protein n=1 Tax=Neobacillus terrae TaxID=3034837 RepID=UPI00140C4829|nr:hypothetical protein [Neobacillus terrae]NHM33991.1 hypothetical protein [Neobacillus terrae]
MKVDLAKSIERLSFSYNMLERINGGTADIVDKNLSALILLMKTKDGRHVIPANIYPKLRDVMQDFLECRNSIPSVMKAISQWDSDELEEEAAKRGIVMGKVGTLEEFMNEKVYQDYLAHVPLIEKFVNRNRFRLLNNQQLH